MDLGKPARQTNQLDSLFSLSIVQNKLLSVPGCLVLATMLPIRDLLINNNNIT